MANAELTCTQQRETNDDKWAALRAAPSEDRKDAIASATSVAPEYFQAADRIAALEARVKELEAVDAARTNAVQDAIDNAAIYQDQLTELKAKVRELEAEREQLIDAGIDKIMAASEEQIKALCRLEGHDPDDEAKLAKYACETAIMKHKLTASRRQVERLKELWFSDADPLETEFRDEALAAVEKERT